MDATQLKLLTVRGVCDQCGGLVAERVSVCPCCNGYRISTGPEDVLKTINLWKSRDENEFTLKMLVDGQGVTYVNHIPKGSEINSITVQLEVSRE